MSQSNVLPDFKGESGITLPFYNIWEQVQTLGPRTQSSLFGSIYFSSPISLFLLSFSLLNTHQYERPFLRTTQWLHLLCVLISFLFSICFKYLHLSLKSAPWHLSETPHSPKNTQDFIFSFLIVLLWFLIFFYMCLSHWSDSHKGTNHVFWKIPVLSM